jgi:hypothetical protein
MSKKNAAEHKLGRRHWIVMALSAMAGCGGGSGTTSNGAGASDAGSSGGGSGNGSVTGGDTTAGAGNTVGDTHVAGAPGTGGTGAPQGSSPGTGGTGIFSHGSISAFGSVVLNGIHFDEAGARIQVDGASSGRGDLRLGMVAGVQGERYADGLTGRADSIEVWSIARGPVTASRAGQFTVMGMTINTQGSTFWEGVGSSGPSLGQWVAVWGLQADASASTWKATRVAVVSASNRVVATGMVSTSDGQYVLNGVELSGDDAERLHKGRVTRIEGKWEAGDSKVEVLSHHELDVRSENVSPSTLVEIEGVVTSLLGSNRFALGSVTVDASGLAPDYAKLKIGMKLEVYGTWQGQVLKATEFELEDD